MIIDLMLEVFTNKDRPHVKSPFVFFLDYRPRVRGLYK